MKLSITISLFTLAFTVSALHGPSFHPESSPSRIPQFILDLENDYIKANLHTLELHENPKKALCDHESPLQASLPFNVPDDLFEELFVDNTRFSTPRSGWQNAQDRLSEILDCPAALQSCTSFYVNIYRHDYGGTQQGPTPTNISATSGSMAIHANATKLNFYTFDEDRASTHKDMGESVNAPTALTDLFVKALTSMPKLQTITWRGPEGTGQGGHFETMFTDRQLSLPTVKNMDLAPNFLFLAAMSPNLESLMAAPVKHRQSEEMHRQKVLKTISNLPSMKSVRLKSSWDERDFLELYKAVPRLERLDIDGVVDYVYDPWREDPVQPEGYKLRKYLRLLRLFGQLKTLGLPDPAQFGMHISSIEGHSWAYLGVLGAKFGRYEAFRNMQKTEEAARIVIEELPGLERLCIGGACTNLTNPEALKWPWTGRVRDYLLNKYGRCNSEYDGELLVEDPNGPVFFTWDEDKTWLEAGKEPGQLKMMSADRDSMHTWDRRNTCEFVIR